MMRDLQTEIQELLQGDPYFADLLIFTQRTGQVDQMVNIACGAETGNVNSKVGLAIVITMALMKIKEPNIKGPFFNEVLPIVRVFENVELNMDTNIGTGKPSEDVAEYIAATLHGRMLDSAEGALYCPEGILLSDDPVYHGYDIPLRTEGGILYAPTQVAPPAITIVGGNVTGITCATGGATIYQTVNGTRPTPNNSIVMGFPYAVAPGTVVKARAYKATLRGSEISKAVA
jgi:hypothetical protein